METIGIAGAGTMGSGIAQIAAMAGHPAKLYDPNLDALKKAESRLRAMLEKLEEKGKLEGEDAASVFGRITITSELQDLNDCNLIIEAIIENLEAKKGLFRSLESICTRKPILASNTSSLSIASIASAVEAPERVIGIHFFNPAPLMPLVEIVPAIQTDKAVLSQIVQLIRSWKKVPVTAKDTPGFIVNRIARPFYGEAIRIYEEGIADIATIDWAMKEIGGFKMGPFELMDYIGNDINYTVTETVFREFFYDPRYRPSFTQKRMFEAGYLGRKSGRGYYDYDPKAETPEPKKDHALGAEICDRIVAMLINEAIDALYLGIASLSDLDVAMTKGVNYPKGLLRWADEIGPALVLRRIEKLQSDYMEDRYRPSILLKKMVQNNQKFYSETHVKS